MNNINGKMCNLLSIGNLPSSYTVSMSYEEQLLWIANKLEKEIIPDINEIISFINNMDYNFEEINKQINDLQIEVQFIRNQYQDISSKVDTNTENITLLNAKINNDINDLDNKLTALINSNYTALKNYVDYQDETLNEKIENIQIGAIKIYDPTTGTIEPLQEVINNLYQLTNKDGLSATEFDGLELTATEFDGYEITAYEFDSQGKTILV